MTTFMHLQPVATLRGQGIAQGDCDCDLSLFGWRSSPSLLAYLRTTGSIASGSMRRRSSCGFPLCLDRPEQRPVDIGPVPGEVEIRAYPCSGLRVHREGIAAAAFARDTK